MSDELILNQIKSEVRQRQNDHHDLQKDLKPHIVINSKFSIHFKDYHNQYGRYGIMTRMDFKKHTNNSDNIDQYDIQTHNCYVVLNSRTLTVFESQSVLNILSNFKIRFVKIKDLDGTSCFFINNSEDEIVHGVTLCAINKKEKSIWINDINNMKQMVQ